MKRVFKEALKNIKTPLKAHLQRGCGRAAPTSPTRATEWSFLTFPISKNCSGVFAGASAVAARARHNSQGRRSKLTRKIDKLTETVKGIGAKGLAWSGKRDGTSVVVRQVPFR